MPTIGIETGDALKQYGALITRLRRAENGVELRRQLNTRIQAAGQRALRSAQQGARGVQVSSPAGGGYHSGLRERVANATEIKSLPRGVRIRVVAKKVDPKYGRSLARSLDAYHGQRWVHPLFGNQERQYTQQGQEFFHTSIAAHADDFRQGIVTAMRDMFDQIRG